MKQDYQKLTIAIRYWMLGKEYHLALRAMEFAKKYHVGLRKDGVTPEFQHQISQANFARTLNLLLPEATLITIFLHDVVEDYKVKIKEIEDEFGNFAAENVDLMTNQYPDGTKKSSDLYYKAMIQSPVASIAKGCDRMHNHQSALGVFTESKIQSYIDETDLHILPMLKEASRLWVEQEAAYMNIRHILQTQMEFLSVISK